LGTVSDGNVGDNRFILNGAPLSGYAVSSGVLTVRDVDVRGGIGGTGSTTLTISSGTVSEGSLRILNVSLPGTINATNTPLTMTTHVDTPFLAGYTINGNSVSGSTSFTLVIPAGQHQVTYTLQTVMDGSIPDNIYHLSGSSLPDYNFFSGTLTVTNSDARQTPVLTITSLSATVVGGTLAVSYTTTATLSNGGAASYHLVSGSGSATIDSFSGMLTGTRAGTVQLEVTSLGDTNYNGATAVQTIMIGRGTPTLSLLPLPPVHINVGGSTVVTAVSTPPLVGGIASSGVIKYSIISGGTSASINANTGLVTGIASGDIVIQASQSADVNYYSPAPASLTISIAKGAQILRITSANIMSENGSLTATVTSTALGGGGTVSYTIISMGGIATIDPLTHLISATQGGQVVLTAMSGGDANYLPASTSQTITIVSLSMTSSANSLLEGTNGSFVLSLNPVGITLLADVTFTLTGSVAESSHYSLPSSIVLSAGQASVSIPVQALTDKVLYNSEPLVLTASTTYLNSVSGTIGIDDVTSLDRNNLVVTIGDGTIFSEGTIQIKASLPVGVTSKRPIVLSIIMDPSSESSLLAGPLVHAPSVTIPVDRNFEVFDVTALSGSDQPAHIYLDGSNAGFTVNQGVVTVLHKKLDLVIALSNNGDGTNDCLTIQNIEKYPDNRVSIIDRRGILVYDGRVYDNNGVRFCGRSNQGHSYNLPSGTYYYTIRLVDKTKNPNNTLEEISFGYLELRY